MMDTGRRIIHIDMDAFYASVEQRDRPELLGKPVIVGGNPDGRGVVAACSYEARRFGVRSAMPGARARRLCPQAVFLRPRFEVYRSVSARIGEIFAEYTDLVEPLSLDEAYLDVTDGWQRAGSATRIAQEIRARIRETVGLTASAGVSFNKFLAKVASDFRKPDGIYVIPPDRADAFIDELPIRKFFGVGRVTEKKMLALGIRTGADLRQADRDWLVARFGKAGDYFYAIAHGEDHRPVISHRVRKSVGKETTLAEDIDDRAAMIEILTGLAGKVADGLGRHRVRGRTVTLKVRYADFTSVTRSVTLDGPVADADEILAPIGSLLAETRAGREKVRLLGITVSNLVSESGEEPGFRQLLLPF